MRQLAPLARAYLISCYFLGMLALGWHLLTYRGPISLEDWLLGAMLGMTSAVCQILVVARKSTTGRRSDHLTLAPLFAALLLLPRPVLALVIVITFLPEWYFHRRTWFKQVFNIATFLISAAAMQICLFSLTGSDRLENTFSRLSLDSVSVLLVVPVFLSLQAIQLALVLKMAHGQSFRQSGLFTPRSLLLEMGLICLGLGFATSWVVSPLYGLAAALPLVLIFDALHVPNLKEEAATDSKTGLANMRHFNACLARDLERSTRSGQAFSVLMCDLDYLRNINNTYGHQAGDIVLIGIADIIRRHIRGCDIAARFGGEEFVILLADTDSEHAQHVAERLRSELEQTCFDVGLRSGPISATISIGVATYPWDGRTAEVLLHEADLAVYQAKREGRNRVAVAGRTSRELAGEWAREHLVPGPMLNTATATETQRPFWNFINQVTRASINTEVRPTPTVIHTAERDLDDHGNRRSYDHRKRDPAPRVLALIGAVVAAGLLGLWPGIPSAGVPWGPLALFAALTIVAEQLAVDILGRGKTSVAVVIILSATFLYAEFGILITCLACAVSVAIKARSPLHRMLFNFGTLLLSAEGVHWIFEALVGESIRGISLARMILPAIVAGLAFYVVNHLLLCLVRGLHERRTLWHIWHTEYRWLWPHYAVMGALGLVVALGYLALGAIGLIALMAPVAMMHVAIKQYMDRTTVHVTELEHMNGRLSDSYEATLQALCRALDTRDEETEEHSRRVRGYTELIAQRLGVADDELAHISRGALLHDIGKIGVPDAILLKAGPLSEAERAIMRKHPQIGYSMITHIPFLAKAAEVVLHHHEAYDGSGYPSGLSGKNIPLGARIFAIADTFDAMTSDRPYRKALSVAEARAEIKCCRGRQFDPDIVDTFLAIPAAELMAVRAEVSAPAESFVTAGYLEPVATRDLVLTGA